MGEALTQIAGENRPHPAHVPHVHRLVQGEVGANLFDNLTTHSGSNQIQSRIAGSQVDDEEEDRGDAEDQRDGTEEAPNQVPGHSWATAAQGRSTNPSHSPIHPERP